MGGLCGRVILYQGNLYKHCTYVHCTNVCVQGRFFVRNFIYKVGVIAGNMLVVVTLEYNEM